jgi:GT2 family glycosyltransferase/glycosyltransferase involved in cell wall biosynthesis
VKSFRVGRPKRLESISNAFTNSFINDFDDDSYLDANLDVKKSGLNARYHFIKYGLFERRPLSVEMNFADWVLINLEKRGDFSRNFPWVEMCVRYSSSQEHLLSETLVDFLDFQSLNTKYPGLEDCQINVFEALSAIGDDSLLENLDIPNERDWSEVPETSILILNWNKPLLTLATIASLVKWVDAEKVEIVVIDNGSNGDNLAKLSLGARNFRIISLRENHFFGAGNNFGASKCESKYLIFMNNDVIVESDISECLISTLKSSEDIGTVGPLFIYPNREIQEAGVFVNEDGSVNMIGRNAELPDRWLDKEQIVDYTSAACVAISREDFEKVGGFDYIFEPAYYEDADLCLRVRTLLGKQSVFTPKASVIHLEHQTSTDPKIGIDFSKIVDVNKVKFQSRWDLSRRTSNGNFELKNGNDSHIFPTLSKNQNPSKTKLHIYSPFPLTIGGGERYLLSLASSLSQDFSVTMVFERSYTEGRVHQICRDLNISSAGISVSTVDESRSQHPEILIIMDNAVKPGIYPYGQRNILLCQFPFNRLGDNLRDTFNNLQPIEAIVTYSDFVSSWVERRLNSPNVNPLISVISPPIAAYTNELELKDSSKILAIGRFFRGGHDKNLDFLAEALWELNSGTSPGQQMSLDIVGGVVASASGNEVVSEILAMEDSNVKLHIDADGSTLKALLHNSSIYWHAAGFKVNVDKNPQNCEHFGISPLEAMSAGAVPFAVNNGGPSSYIEDGANGFLYETRDELLEKTKDFLSMSTSRTLEIRRNARETAHGFNQENFAQGWKDLLSKL